MIQHITLQKKPRPARVPSAFESYCDCRNCGLFTAPFKPVPGGGNLDARIIFVGEAPGATEVVLSKPFVGESGQLLNRTLKDVGLRREDVYCTNAVLCQLPDHHKLTVKETMACNRRLKEEILSLPNRHVIVVLGTSAVKGVTGRNDGVTKFLYSMEWSEEYQCFIVYSFHPAACLRNADNYQDVLLTFSRAKALLDVPKGPLPTPRISCILEGFQDDTETQEAVVQRAVRHLSLIRTTAKGYISCDVETTGLDCRQHSMEQLGIGWHFHGNDCAYLIPQPFLSDPAIKHALSQLFARRDIKWGGHNFKFDMQFIKQFGIPEVHGDYDTMLLHKSLDERGGKHELGQVVAKFYNDGDYKKEKDKFTDPIYHSKDCIYALRLGRDDLPAALAREKPSHNGYPGPQYRHDKVLIPAWEAITDIEMNGIPVDREAAFALAKEMGDYPDKQLPEFGGTLLVQQRECQRLAGCTLPKSVKQKRSIELPTEYYQVGVKKGQPKPQKTKTCYDEVIEQRQINLSSPQQIGHLLFDVWNLPIMKVTETGQPSVDEETLLYHFETVQNAEQKAFLQALLDFRKQLKIYSTYVLAAIRSTEYDGLLHTHFKFDPASGRLSSSELNIQNIPSDKHGNSPIKKLYIAPPDHWFVSADYSSQEMRMAAFYAKDAELLKACMESDLHEAVARMVFHKQFAEIDACGDDLAALTHLINSQTTYRGLAAEQSKTPLDAEKLLAKLVLLWRFRAKSVNFGKLYGQTPMGLLEALLSKGVEATLAETTEYHRAWENRFVATTRWLKKQCEDIVDPGFVGTPLGYRRRAFLIHKRTLERTQNQAMNAPIQSLSSDMTTLSFTALHHELKKRQWGRVGFFVHDQIVCYIKKERLMEGASLMKQVMEHALDFLQDDSFYVPFPIDIEYGPGWGDLQKMKLL
jgi:uracil-DNA glycosylase